MATPPQALLDALTGVQADADDVAVQAATRVATAQALVSASTEDTAAAGALSAAQAKQQADLDTFIALVQTTYGQAPPVVPPPPVPGP